MVMLSDRWNAEKCQVEWWNLSANLEWIVALKARLSLATVAGRNKQPFLPFTLFRGGEDDGNGQYL
jgi:hypothetical protein